MNERDKVCQRLDALPLDTDRIPFTTMADLNDAEMILRHLASKKVPIESVAEDWLWQAYHRVERRIFNLSYNATEWT